MSTDHNPPANASQRTSTGLLATAAVALVAAAIMLFLTSAQSVIFRTDPADAHISAGGLTFNIGGNFLFLHGEHQVRAEANGYQPLTATIQVSDQGTQEIALKLEPLPGNLVVKSDLTDMSVTIDGEAAGTVPGTLREISRGRHLFEFSKYRYFSQQQDIDIEGLGNTQSIDIALQPAWGELTLDTVPSGADLYIDNHLIGKTPLTTEVLETGSQLKITAPGYKPVEQSITVNAGTRGVHPPIVLAVADGTLLLTSSPSGASITIDNQFRGTTPATVELKAFQSHKIELFLEGYLKTSRAVSLEPEQQTAVNIALTENSGSLRITVKPADATISVNGVASGKPDSSGQQTLTLPAKPHQISVAKAGYKSQQISVTPRPGHQQALTIELLTLQQDYWATRPATLTSPVGGTLKLFRPNDQFMLGAPRREPGRRANEAERLVALQRPFYLATHETTNAQYRRWKADHSSSALRGNTLDMNDQPVAAVSWQDAALFCNWLSRQEKLPLFYRVEEGEVVGVNWDAEGYRLPTEAEWAWAAKLDNNANPRRFPWQGDIYPPEQVVENYADQSAASLISFTLSNYSDGFPVSAVIGRFPANPKGLYDMGGNVAEWTNDYFDVRPNTSTVDTDPRGPEQGVQHVVRGASWALASRTELRLSYRESGSDGRMDVGFRVARYVDKP